MKPKVNKSHWTGTGYCIKPEHMCILNCESCIYNKKKSEVEVVK